MTEILRYSAFSDQPDGGNPAGVVLDTSGLDESAMQRIAAEVGYAETAFRTGDAIGGDPRKHALRYFSPQAEVPFCGHATIATAVALAERIGVGAFLFETPVGAVRIETTVTPDGISAAFTSVAPTVTDLEPTVLVRLLELIGVGRQALHPLFPPRLANAGNPHPIVVFARQADFDEFRFDPGAVRTLMDEEGWTGTVTTLVPSNDAFDLFEARNLFPVGEITEDPATGSAAAAVGAYLRELGIVRPPARIRIRQGRHVGRPGLLTVDIPERGGIIVSGTATPIV